MALFSDLHYGENAWTDWGPQQDVNSDKVMSTILDHEVPDFVIYLGDVITGNNIPVANASLYWDQAISPTRSRGIPWATIFGNHDDAHFEWPMEWFSSTGIPQVQCLEHCSAVSVSSFDGRNHHPISYLYFLDSGGGSYPEVISSAQATWFENQSYAINSDSRVPELIFWHIPSKAYKNVAPRFGIHRPCVGSINKESVATQEAEMGIMDILVNKPSVKHPSTESRLGNSNSPVLEKVGK
ncbi:hypothetical protein C5167_043344 [Papaver somniferum]|uniref:Calcineurin-like phosphoesterase domain-containing protein n=1 Tax=Papaver somniferum TaxID=3469 RepID=A0A4Y7L824_PAPSO|nr:hypothetical protein C5167_043344 [Papaver somniferum]